MYLIKYERINKSKLEDIKVRREITDKVPYTKNSICKIYKHHQFKKRSLKINLQLAAMVVKFQLGAGLGGGGQKTLLNEKQQLYMKKVEIN